MTCLTGGLTPCGAATGIPGRPATSSSPTCRARAAPTKASPGTPWSAARPTAAAQPGTARATIRPTRRPPAPLGSQAGSHRHPTQGDPEPTEAFDITAITSHPATADTSQLAGSRSHRGSALLSTPPPHAKVPFQRCALRRLSHVAEMSAFLAHLPQLLVDPGQSFRPQDVAALVAYRFPAASIPMSPSIHHSASDIVPACGPTGTGVDQVAPPSLEEVK